MASGKERPFSSGKVQSTVITRRPTISLLMQLFSYSQATFTKEWRPQTVGEE
jgi:hypothetical protein